MEERLSLSLHVYNVAFYLTVLAGQALCQSPQEVLQIILN